jgi:hypothetical protein
MIEAEGCRAAPQAIILGQRLPRSNGHLRRLFVLHARSFGSLVGRQVEVCTGPGPTDYRTREDFHAGQAVPVVIDGHEVARIAVADILP